MGKQTLKQYWVALRNGPTGIEMIACWPPDEEFLFGPLSSIRAHTVEEAYEIYERDVLSAYEGDIGAEHRAALGRKAAKDLDMDPGDVADILGKLGFG